jgi:hypothetical protein
VISNSVGDLNCSDKTSFVRICTIRYDIYWNLLLSNCVVSLLCMYFYTYMHKVKLDHTEQDEQYFTRQTQMNSNDWYHVNWHNRSENAFYLSVSIIQIRIRLLTFTSYFMLLYSSLFETSNKRIQPNENISIVYENSTLRTVRSTKIYYFTVIPKTMFNGSTNE